MLSLDWRIGLYGFPMTVWVMVGWLLLSAGAATLLAFLFRLLWFSLGAPVVERPTPAAAGAERVRADIR